MILIISSFIFNGCNQNNKCIKSVKAIYTNQTELDGCKWMIQLKNKQKINPINLNEFEAKPKEGQKIWISYSIKENMFDACMSGKIVEIKCISNR